MSGLRVFLLLAVALMSRVAWAEVSCPWLTVGTAEAALGGAAKTEVKMLAPPRVEEGRCVFTAENGGTLEIVVSGEAQKECGADGVKVTGVGNEARFCGVGKRMTVEGRVRAMHFRTTLTGALTAAEGRKRVELVAEMLAGNLF